MHARDVLNTKQVSGWGKGPFLGRQVTCEVFLLSRHGKVKLLKISYLWGNLSYHIFWEGTIPFTS